MNKDAHIASIHPAGLTSWLDKHSSSTRQVLIERSSSARRASSSLTSVEPTASSYKRDNITMLSLTVTS